jgi:hypothetical protein
VDVLSEPYKKALLFYMTQYYNISFESGKECTLSEVESALNGIFGASASIITGMIYRQMAAHCE